MATRFLAAAIAQPAPRVDAHDSYPERFALEQHQQLDSPDSCLDPLPPVSVFDPSTVMDTQPWWQPGLMLELPAPVTSAELCAQYVDEFAHLRPRIQTDYVTPPQHPHYEASDMPTELLEAAAVALLASSARGPYSAPPALGVVSPDELRPTRAPRPASGVVRTRTTARRATLDAMASVYQYDEVPTVYCCRWVGCSAVFAAAHELTEHVGLDHIPRRQDVYYCGWSECKRATHCFRHRDKLMVHVRLHTGDRRFRCPEEGCGREFSRADSFEEHRRVHASEGRAQVCSIEGCGRRYYHAKSLRKHQRQVHGVVVPSEPAPRSAEPPRSAEAVSPLLLSPLLPYLF